MARESHWRGNLVAVKSEEDRRLLRWLSSAVAAVALVTDSSDCPWHRHPLARGGYHLHWPSVSLRPDYCLQTCSEMSKKKNKAECISCILFQLPGQRYLCFFIKTLPENFIYATATNTNGIPSAQEQDRSPQQSWCCQKGCRLRLWWLPHRDCDSRCRCSTYCERPSGCG